MIVGPTHKAYVLSKNSLQQNIVQFLAQIQKQAFSAVQKLQEPNQVWKGQLERKRFHVHGTSNILKGYRNLDTSI